MKTFTLIVLLWAVLGGAMSFAQEPIDPFTQANNAAFAGVDKNQVPSGIWRDFGIDLIDLDRFRGTLTDSNYVDITQFRRIHAMLQSCIVNGNAGANFLPLDVLNDQIDRLPYRRNPYDADTIIVPILHLQYHATRSDAVSQNLFTVADNKVYDVAGRSQSPYDLRYAFAAGPELPYTRRSTVSFGFRSDFFVTNTGKTLSQLQADFGDGAGLQTLGINSITQVNYSSGGEKVILIRLSYTDGTVVESRSKFTVVADPGSPNARYAVPGRNDVLTPTYVIDSDMTRAGGNIFVRLSTHNTTGSIRKPLIVAEGFDPNILFPEQAYTFRDFLVQLDFDYIANFNRSFNQQLDEIGEYDLVFVDYQNGIDDIRRNAAMVEEVIRRTNQEKNANGSTIGNVVMGLSMGGLVARYALCEMASRGEATQTRLLITHDSPHRGANVPLSLQALVNDLQSLRIYGTRISSIVPDLRKVQDLLNAPASQQLLIIQDGRVNTFLDNEYRAMISRTIPGCRLVASSNGSQCGHGQALQPLGEVLKIESNFYVNWLTWGAAAALGNAALVIVSGVPVVGEAIAAPAALVLNGALLAITPFVGKNYVFNVYCRALPNQQVQQIFSGSLQAQKRFLGLFPLYSVSLWNASRNSTADMLPWDSAPGGVYDLSYIQAQLPGNPNINAFPFLSVNLNINLVGGFDYIPVVSALDITTVNPTSVYAAYNSGTSPVNPSRFDYFIAQEQVNANTFNTDHIQYTPRNSEWMYNEMEGITKGAFQKC